MNNFNLPTGVYENRYGLRFEIVNTDEPSEFIATPEECGYRKIDAAEKEGV